MTDTSRISLNDRNRGPTPAPAAESLETQFEQYRIIALLAWQVGLHFWWTATWRQAFAMLSKAMNSKPNYFQIVLYLWLWPRPYGAGWLGMSTRTTYSARSVGCAFPRPGVKWGSKNPLFFNVPGTGRAIASTTAFWEDMGSANIPQTSPRAWV